MKYGVMLTRVQRGFLEQRLSWLKNRGLTHITGLPFRSRSEHEKSRVVFPKDYWGSVFKEDSSISLILDDGEVWWMSASKGTFESWEKDCCLRGFLDMLLGSLRRRFLSADEVREHCPGLLSGMDNISMSHFARRVADPYDDFEGKCSPEAQDHLEFCLTSPK